MSAPREEPPQTVTDPSQLLVGYLDWYRSVVARKLDGLSERQLRSTVLPSGWTPLELLQHLVFMERRWLRWGFAGEQIDDPWGDRDPDGERWQVVPQAGVEGLLNALHEGGRRTRAIVATARLDEVAARGGRFTEAQRPTLHWILLHVLQEYARHAGHLDIVRELIDGETGE